LTTDFLKQRCRLARSFGCMSALADLFRGTRDAANLVYIRHIIGADASLTVSETATMLCSRFLIRFT
jgi:hypothetical protein